MQLISIRASSLPELFDCPARWEAKYIYKMRRPRSSAAQLGTAIHAGTSLYDESVMLNQGLTINDAAGAVIDAIYKPDEETEWDELQPIQAEKIALALHQKYCTEITPTQRYIGVELNCEPLTISDIGLTLTGTVDRVREPEPGKYGIADLKTGATAVGADGKVKTQKHGLQLAVYELIASAAIGSPITEPAAIIGLQTGKTDKSQRVGIGMVDSPRDILLGADDRPGMLEYASQILHGGIFHGNPSSMLCSDKYCPAFFVCRHKS